MFTMLTVGILNVSLLTVVLPIFTVKTFFLKKYMTYSDLEMIYKPSYDHLKAILKKNLTLLLKVE
jgi:hypothetical protein